MIKVEQIKNNQFKIVTGSKIYFQSYKTIICGIDKDKNIIYINKDAWFSQTTKRYTKQFIDKNFPIDYDTFKSIKDKNLKSYDIYKIKWEVV